MTPPPPFLGGVLRTSPPLAVLPLLLLPLHPSQPGGWGLRFNGQ